MTQYTGHHGPESLRTRGTIVVVPGRGECQAAYTRFGRRPADAYRVRVVDTRWINANVLPHSQARFVAELAAAVEGPAKGRCAARPGHPAERTGFITLPRQKEAI
ncbi:hypothetical protein [Streptomyces sp. NBC_01707]|uniref:hypothetical protein n=1 Tax=Streptomyces sp. NBC_01707 TaxID=2975914 RepID=UPI002F9105CA